MLFDVNDMSVIVQEYRFQFPERDDDVKNKALKESEPFVLKRWGEGKGTRIMELSHTRLEQLCYENNKDVKAVKAHTEDEIFPCISLYESIQQCDVQSDEALDFLDQLWSQRAESGAESIRKILKFAGLYKFYPAVFKLVARNQYGTAAGFEAKFYDCGRGRCKFDMTKCLYCEVCKKYGCPELTKCFCHVDDVNNANLHPRLCWNRTRFMGGGGDLCDFDIFVTDKK